MDEDDDSGNAAERSSEDRTDRDLLERWRSGEQAAGSKLFERHFPALMRFFRNKIDRGIEDLIQDTMLACVRGRDRLRDDNSFRAYLFATARFVLYEHVRKRNRGEALDAEQQSFADLGPGPSTAYAKHREQQILLQALRMLPIDLQMTLELYYWEGLNGRELADATGVPLGTARNRIRRGSEQLKELVQQLGSSPDLVRSTVTHLEDWLTRLRGRSSSSGADDDD
jgi:RNA polymerase sigma-70 factor, ECF subfamily